MKHLLLIANISIENKRLLEYAADFCKHYQCKLHVLHINNYTEPLLVSSPYYYNQNNIDFLKHQEEQSNKNIATKVGDIIDQELVQISIKKGNSEKILDSFINENFIDLIIIGNKDIDADTDFLDHKNILLNVVDVPLLVVPDLQVFSPYQTFNFLTTHTENDLEHIMHLSKVFNESKIKVSHMDANDTELGIREKNWEHYISMKVPNRINFEPIKENVSDYVRRENYSMIKLFDAFVFTAKKRKFWSRIFDPSTTLGYLAGLEIPCIIYKVGE